MTDSVINKATLACIDVLAEAFHDWQDMWNIKVDIDQNGFLSSGGRFNVSVIHVKYGVKHIGFRYTLNGGLEIEWEVGCFTPAEPKYIFYILWRYAMAEQEGHKEEAKDA